MSSALGAIATGRQSSLFAADLGARAKELRAAFEGRRVLVVGGAGSIGAATLRAIVPLAPAALHVVDQDENGLAELVRDLRSSGCLPRALDLRLEPLDYGAEVARRFIAGAGPYDAVLHFAALKHVRSEKDAASILQMLDTNVLKQVRLMAWLAELGNPARYFAVSTDKAANPVNFMGASKRLMEQLVFTDALQPMGHAVRTSARFANVAFSAGSLLASWGERIRKRQPMSVPVDTRRYFVTLEESAHICLLGAAAAPDRHLVAPHFDAQRDLHELAPIAEAFARSVGYRPAWYDSEPEARAALERDAARGAWPVLRTVRDTDGEKPEEVFAGAGERAVDIGLSELRGIAQHGCDAATLRDVLDQLSRWVGDARVAVDKPAIAACIRRVVRDFAPVAGGGSLDARM